MPVSLPGNSMDVVDPLNKATNTPTNKLLGLTGSTSTPVITQARAEPGDVGYTPNSGSTTIKPVQANTYGLGAVTTTPTGPTQAELDATARKTAEDTAAAAALKAETARITAERDSAEAANPDLKAARERGMTIEQYTAQKTANSLPVTSSQKAVDGTKPIKAQIEQTTATATNQAEAAQRTAMGKARAAGSNLDIAMGLGQFAETEALGQGSQAISTLGLAEATAKTQQEKDQLALDNTAKVNKIAEYKNMLYNDLSSPAARLILIDKMRSIDPNDPIVQMYDANPESFGTQFSAQDLKAKQAQIQLAQADMKLKITDTMDKSQINGYFNSGDFTNIYFPDKSKFTTDAASYSPSAAEIAAYEQNTGKTYGPGDIDSKKDILAYSTFTKESSEWINQANATEFTKTLIDSGMNVDVDQALNIKQLMPVLDKTMAGKEIDVTDSTGAVHKVKWSTDTKDGALAPLFTDWDGKAYAPGQKPSVADSNLDAMFYAMNDSLVANGQAPLTMSQFRGLVTGPMATNPLNVTEKPLTQNNIKAWIQDATKVQNKVNEVEQGTIKVTDAKSAATATSKESFSEATPSEMKGYMADPAVKKNLEKLGFTFLENIQGIGPSAVLGDMPSNIKPGASIIGTDGNIYKISGFANFHDNDTWSGNENGWEITGIDSFGNEKVLYTNQEEGMDTRAYLQKHMNDGSGSWGLIVDNEPDWYGKLL